MPVGDEPKQIARLALCESAARFDENRPDIEDKKKLFKAYSFPRIRGRILRDYLGAWPAHPPKYGTMREVYEAERTITIDDDYGHMGVSCNGTHKLIENKNLLSALFTHAKLTDYQRQIITQYYFSDVNLEEQARSHGVNPRCISKSKTRGLRNMMVAYKELHDGSTSL